MRMRIIRISVRREIQDHISPVNIRNEWAARCGPFGIQKGGERSRFLEKATQKLLFGRAGGRRRHGAAVSNVVQHSTKLRASPRCDVSLYLPSYPGPSAAWC